MKLKQVDEMPESGEFIAVWIDKDGELASNDFKWDDGDLYLRVLFNDGDIKRWKSVHIGEFIPFPVYLAKEE